MNKNSFQSPPSPWKMRREEGVCVCVVVGGGRDREQQQTYHLFIFRRARGVENGVLRARSLFLFLLHASEERERASERERQRDRLISCYFLVILKNKAFFLGKKSKTNGFLGIALKDRKKERVERFRTRLRLRLPYVYL